MVLALRYQHHLVDTIKETIVDESSHGLIYPLVQGAANTLAQADLSSLPDSLAKLAKVAMGYALDVAFIEVMLLASLCSVSAAWFAFKLKRSQRIKPYANTIPESGG